MKVGEEFEYQRFLFLLPGLERGVMEFIDASQWSIRSQNTSGGWKLQYTCFQDMYRQGKDGKWIGHDEIRIQKNMLRTDSRAPGLKEGDKRYVVVTIGPRCLAKLSLPRVGNAQGSGVLGLGGCYHQARRFCLLGCSGS